jgi:outer membrane protein OmpA-like peptidoglycan-associated protein
VREVVAFESPPAPHLPPDPPAPPPEPEAPPPPDADGDGIADADDKCADQPEDKDFFDDQDGCPDPDNDKDNIADADDRCPNVPETVNGIDDKDGCADDGLIELVNGRVVLDYNVLYDTNRARVKSKARQVIAAVVELWRQHPEWESIAVEGHADKRGPERYNVVLSRERARRVRVLLVKHGFPAQRIRTQGFGSSKPRDEGDSAEAYRRNRRVELVVREREGGARS